MVKENKKVETKKEVKPAKKDVKKKKEKKVIPANRVTFKGEFNKIKWPSKKDMMKYSIATIIFVLFFAAFFTTLQYLMALLKSII